MNLPQTKTDLEAAILRTIARITEDERALRRCSKDGVADEATMALEQEQFKAWWLASRHSSVVASDAAWDAWRARNGAKVFMAGKASFAVDVLAILREEMERNAPK